MDKDFSVALKIISASESGSPSAFLSIDNFHEGDSSFIILNDLKAVRFGTNSWLIQNSSEFAF